MADTIREFLVSLGFRLDEASWSRFQSTVESATLKARLFGDALESVAKSVAGAVARVASDFEDLFYASSRLGASVESIRAFGYAVSQMGGTVAGAQSSLRSFGDWMRQTPGADAFLKGFGVATKDAQGHAIDRGQILLSIGEKLAQMAKQGPAGQALATQYAGIFGIDQDTLLAIERQGTRGRYNEAIASDQSAGIGESMARMAAKFQQAFRETFMRIGAFLEGAEGKLLGNLKGPLEKFNTWLDAHKDQVNDALTRIAESAGKIGEKVLTAVEKIDWDKVPVQIDNFAKSLGDLGENFGKFLDNLDRTRKLIEIIALAWLGMKIGGIPGAVIGGAIGYGMANPKDYDGSSEAPIGSSDGGLIPRMWRGVKKWWGGSSSGGEPKFGANAGGAAPRNTADAMRVAMDQLRKEGVPEANLHAAAAALVGQAISESGLNPATSHDGGSGYGIYGAGNERRDAMFSWLAANGYTKNSLEGQMRFMAHEAMTHPRFATTRGMLMTMTPGNVVGRTAAITTNFEAPASDQWPKGPNNPRQGNIAAALRVGAGSAPASTAAAGASPAIGGIGYPALGVSPLGANTAPSGAGAKHVSSNITNNITVASNDPDSAASAVGVHIDRTYADAFRNLQGAVA